MTARPTVEFIDRPARGPDRARFVALLVLAAALAGGGAVLAPNDLLVRAALAVGGTLACLAVILVLRHRRDADARRHAETAVTQLIENDNAPAMVADSSGAVLYSNPSARRRFSDTLGDTLAGSLRSVFANPSAVLFRMQTRARSKGGVSEDIVTRRGQIRISVHDLGLQGFLLRF